MGRLIYAPVFARPAGTDRPHKQDSITHPLTATSVASCAEPGEVGAS